MVALRAPWVYEMRIVDLQDMCVIHRFFDIIYIILIGGNVYIPKKKKFGCA